MRACMQVSKITFLVMHLEIASFLKDLDCYGKAERSQVKDFKETRRFNSLFQSHYVRKLDSLQKAG